MFYPDLTTYSYLRDEGLMQPEDDKIFTKSLNLLNVGWLDNVHPFTTGNISEQFMNALFDLCLKPCNQMRGFHVCPLCSSPPSTPMRLKRGEQEVVIDVPQHMFVERGGQKAWLGSAEIHVNGDNGIIYAAPTMVYHYVAAHSYLPPDKFIKAVIATRKTLTNSS